MTPGQPNADPVPEQTARKWDTTPTSDGDTTTARRQLLAVLLDRVERGALLPTEVPLLRACVTAEQGAADANHGPDEAWVRYGAILDVAQARADRAAVIRVRELASDVDQANWVAPGTEVAARIRLALDGPAVAVRAPETVYCSPLVTALCPGHTEPPYCERAASTQTPTATCAALYAGEPGEAWHCTLNAGHNGDHVSAEDGNNYWNDHVASYPAADAVSEPQP